MRGPDIFMFATLMLVLLTIQQSEGVSKWILSRIIATAIVSADPYTYELSAIQKKMTLDEIKKTVKNLRKPCQKKTEAPKGTHIYRLGRVVSIDGEEFIFFGVVSFGLYTTVINDRSSGVCTGGRIARVDHRFPWDSSNAWIEMESAREGGW